VYAGKHVLSVQHTSHADVPTARTSTRTEQLQVHEPRSVVQQRPDLQNILRQSYDYLTIMPKLRSTYDGRLIYKTSYNEWKAFHRYDARAKS